MNTHNPSLRQLVIGLIAIPLSVIPFVAYLTMTPEGRLVRDRAIVALHPPELPTLSASDEAQAAATLPAYDGGVMVLAYHGIGSADAEGGFVVPPARFGEHLATMRAAGVHFVTARQVAEAFDGGPPLPTKAVMLTFDDGRADAMMFADPLLDQAGAVATMFVITDAASEPGVYYAGWDEIEKYHRSGRWDIESHTASLHREHEVGDGRSLPALTSLAGTESIDDFRARIRSDLANASAAIEAHTGSRPVAFAYPFGAYGADRSNDARIEDVVSEEVESFYTLAFHQDEQESIPLATCNDARLKLRRLEVEDWSGIELLERIAQAAVRAEKSSGPDDC